MIDERLTQRSTIVLAERRGKIDVLDDRADERLVAPHAQILMAFGLLVRLRFPIVQHRAHEFLRGR